MMIISYLLSLNSPHLFHFETGTYSVFLLIRSISRANERITGGSSDFFFLFQPQFFAPLSCCGSDSDRSAADPVGPDRWSKGAAQLRWVKMNTV